MTVPIPLLFVLIRHGVRGGQGSAMALVTSDHTGAGDTGAGDILTLTYPPPASLCTASSLPGSSGITDVSK